MEYTVSQLARLSGVSARTLRYYDEIALLKPKRTSSSGYRIYGQVEVDLLQQILFYRELEMKREIIPVVALRGLTVFPHLIIHFDLNRQKSIAAVEQAMMQEQEILLVAQKDAKTLEPDREDLYDIGTVAVIRQVTKLPGKVLRFTGFGIKRDLSARKLRGAF